MSFLLNLARRAAGLSIGEVQPPNPSRLQGETRGADLDASDATTPSPPTLDGTGASAAITSGASAPAIQRSPALQHSPATAEPAPPRQRTAPEPTGPERSLRLISPAPALELREPADSSTPGLAHPPRAVPPAASAAAASPAAAVATPAQPEGMDHTVPHPIVDRAILAPASHGEPVDPVVAVALERAAPGPPLVPLPRPTRDDVGSTALPHPSQPRVVIRPAMTGSPAPRLARPTSAPGDAAPPPVHVRIGRIEVRGTPAAAAPRQAVMPSAPAALGFGAYTRARTYRSWSR